MTRWLLRFAIAAALFAGGYLLFASKGQSDRGKMTPYSFSPAPGPLIPGGRPGGPPPPGMPGITLGREVPVVDLNTASLADIQTLPAMTPEYARKIVAGRPYKSMTDLERAGIPYSIIEQITPPAIIRVTESGPLPSAPPKKKP